MATDTASVSAELPVELAGEAAEEGHRHEYRDQHQSDRHTGPETSCIAALVASSADSLRLSMIWCGFDHDDGVVHHQTDASTSANRVSVLSVKPSATKALNAADEGHRDREHRDKRGAPAFEEDEYHQDTTRPPLAAPDHFAHRFRTNSLVS